MTNHEHDHAHGGRAEDAARLLAEWFDELGYLEQADAAQIVSDAFGDALVWTTALGRRAIRPDVLDALQDLMAEKEATGHFASWGSGERRHAQKLRPTAD